MIREPGTPIPYRQPDMTYTREVIIEKIGFRTKIELGREAFDSLVDFGKIMREKPVEYSLLEYSR